MLTKRIIPCLDVDNGRVVKGVSFVDLKDAGDPVELSSFYDQEGADELVLLDITASAEKRGIIVEVVKQVSDQVFIPLTVGGGIRNSADIKKMLEAGADKVSINTAGILDPKVIEDNALNYGSQCIVAAVDARRINDNGRFNTKENHVDIDLSVDEKSIWEVFINGGRTPTGIDALKWIDRVVNLGAGEILLTSMDADGQQAGYDLKLTRAVSDLVGVPVIASGGVGTLEHLYKGATEGSADALLAASIFHYGTYSIREAKDYLSALEVPVRPLPEM